ncbi:hypothetical protein ES705_05369 [subsurface metagenome]
MNEELKRMWSWKSYKLVLLDFGILNIRTGANSFELEIRTKEPGGEKIVSYIWNPKELEKFYQELEEFNNKVAKVKDLKNKMIVFNCGEKKMQTSLYFKKDQWQKFYNTIEEAYKNYLDQKKMYAGF